jgi:hypothetical protein
MPPTPPLPSVTPSLIELAMGQQKIIAWQQLEACSCYTTGVSHWRSARHQLCLLWGQPDNNEESKTLDVSLEGCSNYAGANTWLD